MRNALAIALVSAAVAAPSAQAAAVDVRPGPQGGTLVFAAAPGERNDVLVEVSGGTFVVHDSAGSLDAGAGCDELAADTATCGREAVVAMELDAGDRDDRLQEVLPGTLLSQVRIVRLRGGAGDDELLGWRVSDELDGGPGADYVSGGPGNGVDTAVVDGHGDGGGVTVTLDSTANDGLPGEGDDIRSDVEVVLGGPGPDVLTGKPGEDRLNGAGGDDRLEGLRGPDLLEGGAGVDLLAGGRGADTLEAGDPPPGDGPPETASCGSGWDFARGDPQDAFGTDCEQYEAAGVLRHNRPTRASGRPPGLPATVAPIVDARGSRALVPTGCASTGGCSGSVELTAGGARLGRARFAAGAGQVVLVRLPLTARGRALVARTRRGRVVVRARGDHGGARVTRRSVRLLG